MPHSCFSFSHVGKRMLNWVGVNRIGALRHLLHTPPWVASALSRSVLASPSGMPGAQKGFPGMGLEPMTSRLRVCHSTN